jgi:hypothetical protein
MTILQFPKLQADLCRLHNRQVELEEQREVLNQLHAEPNIAAVIDGMLSARPTTPTPFGWFLLAVSFMCAVRP